MKIFREIDTSTWVFRAFKVIFIITCIVFIPYLLETLYVVIFGETTFKGEGGKVPTGLEFWTMGLALCLPVGVAVILLWLVIWYIIGD